ncbi:hypothetical protein GIB67_030203 [Kingdonia uniflora]|uniref:Uncharacterized protein n=1 Tax=Kingdonia uniflora TaxID=39325 RepID=A0A7J7MN34_9MAGN|nr:hypothetical protein GIB67_030203 [Kingdonia uniflora]
MDLPPMSASYGAEKLWHIAHGMRQLCLVESGRDVQRLQKFTDENATLRRHLDSVDNQLYLHDLYLRRGRGVWVMLLPPGGSARTRQRNRGSGSRTRGTGSSRSGPS